MSCPPKLYVSKAFDIALTISADSDFVVSDISDLVVTLTLTISPGTVKTFTKSLGEITISGSTITLLVLATDITASGWYSIKIDMTDTGSKVRGITPCPAKLKFNTQ